MFLAVVPLCGEGAGSGVDVIVVFVRASCCRNGGGGKK